VSEKEDDPPPQSCADCGYHARTKECRRHAPHPGHDEEHVVVLWNLTPADSRCGAGTTTKQIVPCYDCTHWHLPNGRPLDPPYKQGLSDEWWANARLCTANAPGAATGEGLETFWKVTSALPYPATGAPGGCGDGVSITEILTAQEKQRKQRSSSST
jgi:hypothetical protein